MTISGMYVDTSGFERFLNRLVDDTTMLRIHQMIARRCDPYVPYDTGRLSQSGLANVSAQGIKYLPFYSYEQYCGVNFHHKTEHHPKATAYWDKVMMQERGDEVKQEIQEILARRARELNGE